MTGTKIEHPLHGSFRVRIVAQLSIGVGEKTIDEDVVRDLLIKSFSSFEGRREFVAAEKEPDVDLLAFQIAGREVEGFLQSVFGLRVVLGIGCFTGATRQCDRELVVTGVLRRFGRNSASCTVHAALCRGNAGGSILCGYKTRQ